MGIWLGVRHIDENRIEYGVTWGQRIVFTVIGLTILLSILSTTERLFQATNSVALVLVGICIFAAVYTESWRFNRAELACDHLVGIPGLLRVQTHPLDDSASLKLVKTTLPARRGYTSLLLVLGEERPLKIDMARGDSEKLKATAAEIAKFCQLALEEDES